jgi:hypothetical protein
VKPRLIEDAIVFEPHIPQTWNRFESRVALGKGTLEIGFKRETKGMVYTIKATGLSSVMLRFIHNEKGRRLLYEIPLKGDETLSLIVSGERVMVGETLLSPVVELQPSMQKVIGELRFAEPKIYPQVKAHKEKDYLKTIIDKKEYHKYLPKTKGGLFGW